MNWHGISSKFSDHYIQRQSGDKSIFKSTKLTLLKRLKDYAVMSEKKELQEFDNARQILLLKKKKEKAKHSRLVTLLENNKALDKRMEAAALLIQRYARGYLTRRQYRDQMWKITLKLLNGKVDSLETTVDKCLKFIGDTAKFAAVVIQKHARRYLAQKRAAQMKVEKQQTEARIRQEKAVLIQRVVRGHLARKRVKAAKDLKELNEKLEKIRQRLLILRLKDFWHRKKFVWEVIRLKYRDRLDLEPASSSQPSVNPEPIKDSASHSNMISAASSRVFSQRNSVYLKEVPQVLQEKPPKVPKPLTLQYLKPTEAYLSRISQDLDDKEKTVKLAKLRTISGRRYQRNTSSRTRYIRVVQTEKSEKSGKTRAVSADYKNRRENTKTFEKPSEPAPYVLSLLFENEVPRYFSSKTNPKTPASLLSQLEDQPSPAGEDQTEKIYVYNPPKVQSLSFREALPDVNTLLETYGRSLKNN